MSGLPWSLSQYRICLQCRRPNKVVIGLPGWLSCNAGDAGSILGWKDSLEEGMATHSSGTAWKNLMDRGAWWALAHGVSKNQTQLKQMSTHAKLFIKGGY